LFTGECASISTFRGSGARAWEEGRDRKALRERRAHPQEYHEEVFDRLRDAMKGCRSMQQCREALTAELRRLAKELETEGTHLNKLVMRTEWPEGDFDPHAVLQIVR
jgi:truncated hemoglobin YjbI